MDVLTKQQRKLNMSRIKATNTTPEVKLRKILYSDGLRGYRKHYHLLGKPDIVFIGKRLAIFIDGCFWHRCKVCFRVPKTRREFWITKINSNIKRDKYVNKKLRNAGWRVLRLWEHEIRREPQKSLKKIKKVVNI